MDLRHVDRSGHFTSKVRAAAQRLSVTLQPKRATRPAGSEQASKALPRTTPKLGFGQAIQKHKSWILAVTWLLLAGGFGNWASESSEASAILSWEKRFRPSLRILHHALGSRSYTFLKDEKKVQKVEYTLPSTLDQRGSFWSTQDYNWIVYFTEGEDTVRPHLYCLDCSKKPENWREQGLGWRALDSLLETLDVLAAKRPKAVKRGSIEYRDPREIRF